MRRFALRQDLDLIFAEPATVVTVLRWSGDRVTERLTLTAAEWSALLKAGPTAAAMATPYTGLMPGGGHLPGTGSGPFPDKIR